MNGEPAGICIGCGCTDDRACVGGCWWLRVDRALQVGVCSECADLVPLWDAGARTPPVEVVVRYSGGAYNVRAGRLHGSSTCNQERAVRHLAEKLFPGRPLQLAHLNPTAPWNEPQRWCIVPLAPAAPKESPCP